MFPKIHLEDAFLVTVPVVEVLDKVAFLMCYLELLWGLLRGLQHHFFCFDLHARAAWTVTTFTWDLYFAFVGLSVDYGGAAMCWNLYLLDGK